MKVTYEIPSALEATLITIAMEIAARDDSYVGHRIDGACHTYCTCGGNRYIVDLCELTLTFTGGRRSLAYGCGFACVRNGRDGHEIELFGRVSAVILLELVSLETSCTTGRGAYDPYACGKELVEVEPPIIEVAPIPFAEKDWREVLKAFEASQ
jgi:hypothetical protein